MPYFTDNEVLGECMRLRDKLNNQFFGKIYRDPTNAKTIKSLGIKNGSCLVVQLLEQPESLSDKETVLLLCKRDITNRTYTAK